MKILFFSKYSKLGSSSRYRIYQYIPLLKAKGIACDTSFLLNDEYLKTIYDNKNYNKFKIVFFYLKRVLKILSIKKYDLVIIEKELFPYFPPIFEFLLKVLNVKFILDYDDATFHTYDLHKDKVVKFVLKNKISKIMRMSSCVITGSPYLSRYAEKYNSNVIEIPTVVDLLRYNNKFDKRENEFIIGWIGSHSTSKYLLDILPALSSFCKKYDSRVKLIGFDKSILSQNLKLPIEIIEWDENTEIENIFSFSVGIMPLEDTPWSRGKCGFKLIQYLACGKPVIASPIGVNNDIVDEGINGFLAKNNDEWFKYLERIYLGDKFRNDAKEISISKVKEKYSLEKAFSLYYKVVKKCMD